MLPEAVRRDVSNELLDDHSDLSASFRKFAQKLTGFKPEKTAVKSAGVVVGRVESISFDDKSFQARVTLALQNRYSFPKDSSLKILTSGLLGEQYIGIEPGAADRDRHIAIVDQIQREDLR